MLLGVAGIAGQYPLIHAVYHVVTMQFPDSLPHILFYHTGCVIIATLPRRPVEYISSSGETTARIVHPTIPANSEWFSLTGSEPWRPITELPAEWLPYLNRERGTEHDPRPPLKQR